MTLTFCQLLGFKDFRNDKSKQDDCIKAHDFYLILGSRPVKVKRDKRRCWAWAFNRRMALAKVPGCQLL